MTSIDQIEAAILQLPTDEFQRLAQWVNELSEQR